MTAEGQMTTNDAEGNLREANDYPSNSPYLIFSDLYTIISIMIWRLLDIFFVIFHTFIILFNLFGWIWSRTRRYNMILLLLTGGSWLFLGLLVGTLGYCPLTDWHFEVLERLGMTDLPLSYIKYLADRLTGLSFSSSLVDNITLYSFLTALLISLFLNIRDFRKSHN